jgi:hypothetical protein
LEPRGEAMVGVERCNLGMQESLGDKGDESFLPKISLYLRYENMFFDVTCECVPWHFPSAWFQHSFPC